VVELIEPAGATLTRDGLLTYDTRLQDPAASSFDVVVRASNAGGEAHASWTVTLKDLPQLVGLWRFEEGSGVKAADDSPADNDGTLVGGAGFLNDPERGSVMSFDGSGWVDTGAFVTELGNADFSYAVWLKTTQAGGVMISKQSNDDAWWWSEKKLYISPGPGGDGGGSPAGAVSTVGFATDWISSVGPLVNDGAWHHVALTFQRGLVGSHPASIYVDGQPVPGYARQDYNGLADILTDTVYMGRTPGGEGTSNFVGLLDDVAIFSVALTQQQVSAILSGDFGEFTGGGGVGPFVRGDCNGDGKVTGQVTDAVFLLNFNFLGGDPPPCSAACDINGDGAWTGQVTDAVYILNYNFLGGPAPPAPFPGCGLSTLQSDKDLGCATPTPAGSCP